MKELTNKWIKSLMFLLMISALLSTSCKKDDEDDEKADYVGKWTSEETITSEEGTNSYKDIMTLTRTTFEDIIMTPDSEDEWVDSFILKGTISANGNVMDVHVTEISVSDIDPDSGEFTGRMTTYKEGSLLFEAIIAESGQDKDFQSEYSIEGNQMTLKTDTNDDGDYNDPNETTLYTRVQ